MTPSAAVTFSASKPSASKISMFRRAAEMEKGSSVTRAIALRYSFSTRLGLSIGQEHEVGARQRGPIVPFVLLDLEDGIGPQDQVQGRRDPLFARLLVRECVCGLVGIVEARVPRAAIPLREEALDLEQRQRVGAGIVAAQILGVGTEVGLEGDRRDARTQGPHCRARPPPRRASRRATASWHCSRRNEYASARSAAVDALSSARSMAWSERVSRSCASATDAVAASF